ncbi:unnamed protein product [Gadus morhua 'NCC']
MPPVPSPRPVALRPRVSDSVDASDTSAALQLSSGGPQSMMGVGTRTLEVSEEEPGAVMELSNPALNVLTKQRPANTPPASLADPASCSGLQGICPTYQRAKRTERMIYPLGQQ